MPHTTKHILLTVFTTLFMVCFLMAENAFTSDNDPRTPKNYGFLTKGLRNAETGGEENPWIHTRHSPPGGSSAYGPLQLTQKTVSDFYNRHPEIFEGTGDFYDKFSGQANKFLRYGNEPGLEGYRERYDYGGRGDYHDDESFRKSYNTVAKRILRKKLGPDHGIFRDGLFDNNEMRTVAEKWRGSPPNDSYMQRFRSVYDIFKR